MNEGSKKRMEAKIEELYSNPRGRRIAAELYQAGMRDPAAQKELLDEVERFVIDVARFKDNPWKLSIMTEEMIKKLRAVKGEK